MEKNAPNDLIHQNSPYLLQHAYNPVQWKIWDASIFEKSKKLNKPILVSIGYAACHWCHVMEKESFEDEVTAAFMNEHFINIKIDREERPDLDQIYMDAVQVLTGSGGWPLHVFLNSDGLPFYGGTYFPKTSSYNRPTWLQVLQSITTTWNQNRGVIEKQAASVMEHLVGVNNKLIITSNHSSNNDPFNQEACQKMCNQILQQADSSDGGFGHAPKFPQLSSIKFLLTHHHFFKNEQALHQALLSLNKIIFGGIYDQLGGGISRYSTDSQWLVPHFEKMLYDNALLIEVLSDAFQITGDKCYEEAIKKTIEFCKKELKSPKGGYYASIDADSEGEEGKYYVWEKSEVESLLGEASIIFSERYGVVDNGNWESKNILHVKKSLKHLANTQNCTVQEIERSLRSSEELLINERDKRIKPSTDNKIILSWNAQLLIAFCRAYAALGIEEYKDGAIELYEDIKRNFSKNHQVQYHSVTNEVPNYQAYLDDYAYWIKACIHLQEISSNQTYLVEAIEITEKVKKEFEDEATGYFFYTSTSQKDVIIRKIDLYDNPIPCGNSIMCENLNYLGRILDKENWVNQAKRMLLGMCVTMEDYPLSFSHWCNLYLLHTKGMAEVTITGNAIQTMVKEVLKRFLPNRILQSSTEEKEFPFLLGKNYESHSHIYLCFNNTCFQPIETLIEFDSMICLKINN